MTAAADHHAESGRLAYRLRLSCAITAIIFVAEVAGGILTGSLALLSDAGHVFADLFALAISAYALSLARVPPDPSRTYGYHRAEVFAALLNGLGLVAISIWIVFEAVSRFQDPVAVRSGPMVVVAVAGLLANLLIILLLRGHTGGNLNARSALMHVIGDLLASVVVVVGGVVMWATGFYLIDPLLSLLVVAILVRASLGLVKEAAHILLEGTPSGIQLVQVERAILGVQGVEGVHDLHIWSLCSEYAALSAHVLVREQSTTEARRIVDQVGGMLAARFRIIHATIQVETAVCAAGDAVVCLTEHSH